MDVQALQNFVTNISGRLQQLATKKVVPQAQMDALENDLNNIDTTLATIVSTPDPGPRNDLDFSILDNAVLAFKSNGKITQNSVNNVAGLLIINTPK